MPRICSLELSRAVAETALARLWLCLEAYSIATPELRFEFPANGRVRITALSNAPPEAVSLLRAWAGEWRDSRARHEPRLSGRSTAHNIDELRAKLRPRPDAASAGPESAKHPVSAAVSVRKLGAP
jgi:hypothetical protein